MVAIAFAISDQSSPDVADRSGETEELESLSEKVKQVNWWKYINDQFRSNAVVRLGGDLSCRATKGILLPPFDSPHVQKIDSNHHVEAVGRGHPLHKDQVASMPMATKSLFSSIQSAQIYFFKNKLFESCLHQRLKKFIRGIRTCGSGGT